MATIVKFYKDGRNVKDITSVGYLPVDEDAVKDSRHLASSGSVIAAAALGEESMMANLPIADSTLRFSFGKLNYDPTVAGVGSAGTWTKKNTKFTNVWDWTNEDTDWSEAFKGAFPDEDNPVEVIAAGDTSSVTNISKMFAGIYANTPQQASYSLTSRNNIVSCVPFDVSNCISFNYCFCGTCLKEVVRFHYNNMLTYSGNISGLFADTYITKADDIDLCGISTRAVAFLAHCAQLSRASFKGVEHIDNLSGVFILCRPELKEVTIDGELTDCTTIQGFIQNAYYVTKVRINAPNDGLNCQAAFNGGKALVDLSIQVGKPSRVDYMFTNCFALPSLPLIDTSTVSHFEFMMYECHEVETIPDYDVSSAVTVQNMCKNMYKAKYGILEMYNKLAARGSAITNHTDCFKDCGRDTEEGRAALAQIPTSWGGTLEETP